MNLPPQEGRGVFPVAALVWDQSFTWWHPRQEGEHCSTGQSTPTQLYQKKHPHKPPGGASRRQDGRAMGFCVKRFQNGSTLDKLFFERTAKLRFRSRGFLELDTPPPTRQGASQPALFPASQAVPPRGGKARENPQKAKFLAFFDPLFQKKTSPLCAQDPARVR